MMRRLRIAAIMGEHVKVPGRMFAAFGLLACLEGITLGCGSRSAPGGMPGPQPPDVPVTAPKPEPVPPPPAAPLLSDTASSDCAVIAGPGGPVATAALGDRIDPSNAPRPSNEGERLLFRQVYETLIRVDCNGHVRPGLAASWRLDADRRTWIINLREDARFSDGTAVTPIDVRASWTRDGSGSELRPDVARLVRSIVPIDDRNVAIRLRGQHADVPMTLAHTDLAIARPVVDSPWPLGTRSDGASPEPEAPGGGAHSVIAVKRHRLPPLRFVVAAGDPRDVLDDGVDLLLTRDPAALDYAATMPHFQSVPLEWGRIHVLLTPGRTRESPLPSAEARQTLATDAVRGESRGAMGPFWWQALQDCETTTRLPNQSAPTARIVYDARDGAARDLAERLVGLARDSSPHATALLNLLLPDRARRTYQRANGLTGEPLDRARRLGTDAGYIVPLDRRPLDPCRDTQVVMDGTPWLDPEAIVPLVETRLRAIVRRGRSGITAEWDGGLVIAGASDPEQR